ncbi:MAG: hypothetical protein AAFQ68_04445 [Bacteroidota bacterium]
MKTRSKHPKRKNPKRRIPVRNAYIILGNTLGLMLVLVFLLGMGMERFHYQRVIEFSLPPLESDWEEGGSYFIIPDYGEVAVIIGEEGEYYVHLREKYHLSPYQYLAERTEIETGLNADCLHRFSAEEFDALMEYLLFSKTDYVLTFSCLPETRYGDFIRFLDKLNLYQVRRYTMAPLTKEEAAALRAWKAEREGLLDWK